MENRIVSIPLLSVMIRTSLAPVLLCHSHPIFLLCRRLPTERRRKHPLFVVALLTPALCHRQDIFSVLVAVPDLVHDVPDQYKAEAADRPVIPV